MGGMNNIKSEESLEKSWISEKMVQQFQHLSTMVGTKNIVALKWKSLMLWIDAQIQISATWPNENSSKARNLLEHIQGNLSDSDTEFVSIKHSFVQLGLCKFSL
jgi:hypothetical protein